MLSTIGLFAFSLSGFSLFVFGLYLETYWLAALGLLLMFLPIASIMVEIFVELWNK